MNTPLVSVLLSVYNGEQTLARCLQSIKQQTHPTWELIAVDDGSKDATLDILQKFAQQNQCRIIVNQSTIGLTRSLNVALHQAGGKYIARIDADDEWALDKIAKQVQFLESRPDIGVLGTWYVNRRGHWQKQVRLPVTHADISRVIYRMNPFGHSCVMVRTNLMQQVSRYDEHIQYGQDYDLWLRLLPHTHFHNLPEYLCTRGVPLQPNRDKQKRQMRQMIQTIFVSAVHNHAGLVAYMGILTPLLIWLTPNWLKKLRP